MSDPWPFIALAVILTLIGALVSLLALLSPVRKLCRRSSGARTTVICILGFVSFVISFGLWTRLDAEVVYIFDTVVIVDTFDPERIPAATWLPETQVNRPFVVRELWRRLLIPPSIRKSCYASEAWVCSLADDVIPARSDRWNWKSYLRDVGIGCVSVLTSSILVWVFTRKRRQLARAV